MPIIECGETMLTIIDYKAGNLTSVKLAFAALGVETRVTSDPAEIRAADRLVFPGVGAAASAMDNLRAAGLVDTLREVTAAGTPFLGICLGMQILFDHTEEDGGTDTLGILPGQVRRFPMVPDCKIPQIGWNQVNDAEEYYFVHSYYVEMNPFAIGTTEYAGVRFASLVRRDNILASQFHPEKSGRIGLKFLTDFLSWNP